MWSLADLDVSHHTHHFSVVVLVPLHAVEASKGAEHLVTGEVVSNKSSSDEEFITVDQLSYLELGHEHIDSSECYHVRETREEKGVPTGFCVLDSE